MAFKEEAGSTGTEHTHTTDAPQTQGFSGATTIHSMLTTFGQVGTLGTDGDKFIEDLKTQLNKDGTLLAGKIAVQRLAEPQGAHAFVHNNNAVVLIFSDLIQGELQNFLPKSEYIKLALESLKKSHDKIHLLSAVLVDAIDYPNLGQWTTYISNSLAVHSDSGFDVALSAIGANSEFVIDYDTSRARSIIKALNPKTVQPRVDVGFVVSVKSPKRPGLQVGGVEDTRPLLAVGGFTELIKHADPTGLLKYTPVVRITAIFSFVPLKGIVPLAITLATDAFIRNHLWKAQFSSFAKGSPNIGNLAPDPSGKGLWFAASVAQRDEFIGKHLSPPVLAIDVVEGQPRIPSVGLFGHSTYAPRLLDLIASFFGAQPPRQSAPFQIANIDFIGTIGDGRGNPTDSRSVDYLNLAAANTADDETARLLAYYDSPATRAQIVANKTGSFTSLSQCSTSIVSYELMAFMAHLITQSMRIQSTSMIPGQLPMEFAAMQGQYFASHGIVPISSGIGFGRTNYGPLPYM